MKRKKILEARESRSEKRLGKENKKLMKDFNWRSSLNLNINMKSLTGILILLIVFATQAQSQDTADFATSVSATCKAGQMNIKVLFNNPYNGAVHARDFRNPNCMTFGNGSNIVTMSINLLAKQGSPDYCGVLVSNVSPNKTEERSIQLAVRVHKTLELADDKFFVITCGKTGFSRDDNSNVVLKFFDEDRRVRELAFGRDYQLKAEVNYPNGTNGIKVKNCFGFNKKNVTIPLIDDRGCSVDGVMSRFIPSADGLSATSMITSMFKFPEGAEVQIQCDIIMCNGKCVDDEKCVGDSSAYVKGGRSLGPVDGLLLAATTVFVLDPSDIPLVSPICDQTGIRPPWLLWLAIVLGVLFLIMLLMNLFLCTAMSCSCARTEIIEKEPSIIEEYDPYRSWHGSQYGSRYSLHNGNGMNKGYASGGSTIHSNRSLPIDSDHYAIVHSRPGSRHSGVQGRRGM
ncbi:CLUMA_CG002031, isoform B [Clunio marinus]|uniref:CLUMA_CG002031, isoform B n=1 Tax=Clunio marinus TaxID=568069 RepID=A0A1J1HK05_9DIPT|nr:CLUMA_CG002031, isoform B [Clunio marinus]